MMEELESWLEAVASRLSPAKRSQLARKIGQQLRLANAARVRANVEPDGSPMAPRKKKKKLKSKQTGKVRSTGKMFPRIEMARHMVISSNADHVELSFDSRVAQTAAIHHFGEEAPVVPRNPNSIRVRYPARRLLGIGEEDEKAIMLAAMAWLEGKTP